jgi:hypothetical protein
VATIFFKVFRTCQAHTSVHVAHDILERILYLGVRALRTSLLFGFLEA